MRRNERSYAVTFLLFFILFFFCFGFGFTEAGWFGGARSDDLYALLGVERGATKQAIKKSFKKIAREHHPDVQTTPEAKEAAKEFMAKVLYAYSVLSDDTKREKYDTFGKAFEEDGTDGFTVEEMFERFQQQLPIVSKSLQLQSLVMLRRILNFRGNRLFLLQIYDDMCSSCHKLKDAWEALFHTSLVEGGVLQMLRIDARAAEGWSLLGPLNITYKGEVQVFAIVDGEMWAMPSIASLLQSSDTGSSVFSALLDFVMSFMHDSLTELNSLHVANGTRDILQWLREKRDAEGTLRVLLPPLSTKFLALTLALLHDGVALFRVVPRQALLDFVEGYCEQPVETRDRHGDVVSAPEFFVVSVEQLADVSSDNNTTASAAMNEQVEMRSCNGVHIGVSERLTYRKARNFLKELTPPKHAEMMSITHVTSMSFYEVCWRHCLLWLRDTCNEAPDEAWVKVLTKNYKPFSVGYICLDSEPALRAAFQIVTNNTLVVFLDGDENVPYFLPDSIEETHIAEALAHLLAKDGKEYYFIQLKTPISRLMLSRPFFLSLRQYWYMRLRNFYFVLYTIFLKIYPFAVVFILRKVLRRFR